SLSGDRRGHSDAGIAAGYGACGLGALCGFVSGRMAGSESHRLPVRKDNGCCPDLCQRPGFCDSLLDGRCRHLRPARCDYFAGVVEFVVSRGVMIAEPLGFAVDLRAAPLGEDPAAVIATAPRSE